MNKTRNVPEQMFKMWSSQMRHGDIKAISEEIGYSYPTVFKALKYGHVGTYNVAVKITEYYENRQKVESSINESSEIE